MMGSHGMIEKEYPYEESIGIPSIVSYPPEIQQDETIYVPVATEDWFPTILGLGDVEANEPTSGTDLTSLLRGDCDSLRRPGVMLEFVAEQRGGLPYAEEISFNEETWRGFRTRRYKYAVKGGPKGGDPWLLFDLNKDPYETENLVDNPDYQSEAQRLHGHLREYIDATDDDYGLKPAFGHDGINYWET